jgi:hypothetical protein
MISIIKKSIRYLLALLAFCTVLNLSAVDDDDDFDLYFNEQNEDIFDGISIADIEQLERANNPDPAATRTLAESQMTLEALKLLIKNNQPLWCKTFPPRSRDALYLIPNKTTLIERGGLAVNLFYNMTDKMDVSAGSLFDFDSSFNKNALIMILKGVIGKIGSDPNAITDDELVSLLPLFQKMRIQERKFGALFQTGFVRGPFTLQIQTALQLVARNFFLSPKDQAAIRAITSKVFDSEADEREFYIIKYGLGDTRIKLGLNTVNLSNFQMDVGFEAIFPTSTLASRTSFDNISLANMDLDQLKENGLDLVRAIRDVLLNPTLGNGGHFGFGTYLESKIEVFRDLFHLNVRASYDYLFDNKQTRLIMFKPTKNLEDYKDPDHPTLADVNAIITQVLREYYFPSHFKTIINPGGIFNVIVSGTLTRPFWNFTLGYDFYSQERQKIKALLSTSTTLQVLRIADAEAPSNQQHKVFAEYSYVLRKDKKSEVHLGIGGDTTFYSRNLGRDWTTYVRLSASF